jgi:hypothetical protein
MKKRHFPSDKQKYRIGDAVYCDACKWMENENRSMCSGIIIKAYYANGGWQANLLRPKGICHDIFQEYLFPISVI